MYKVSLKKVCEGNGHKEFAVESSSFVGNPVPDQS